MLTKKKGGVSSPVKEAFRAVLALHGVQSKKRKRGFEKGILKIYRMAG